MTDMQKVQLKKVACRARIKIIESVYAAQSGHPGGSLSAADVITLLYTQVMKVDSSMPQKKQRDRFVLSKGHAAPALYAVLSEAGYFDAKKLQTLRQPGSILQGHPNMNMTPGIDMSTGSLGQGVSAAVGMAKAGKLAKLPISVYALLGDGELEEGQVWEAMMFASHNKLNNLCVIVDVNKLQIDGSTQTVMNSEPLEDKFRAFGCHVYIADGHDFDQMEEAFKSFKEKSDLPTCILLNTVKGKGVSFMENQVGWHGKAPNDMEYLQAMIELKAELEKLEAIT